MASLQVKDVLAHAEKLLEFLQDYARRHELKADNDLLAGLFHEVNRHKGQLEKVLAGFQESTSEEMQQTWLQFSGVENLEEAMNALSNVDEQEEQVILEHLLAAEEALQKVYKLALEQTDATELQELFGQLLKLQDHHLRNIGAWVSEYGQMRRG